ncbi:class F sortase [Agromyces sp. SYSU T00194]|uniref:class F sortase n=1 Tax=Agromyces chitinivorans TaxID=3158560 RepID=UPI00339904E6
MVRTREVSVAAACCAGAALAALLAAGLVLAGAAGSTDAAGPAPVQVIDASVPAPSAASVEPAARPAAEVEVRSASLDELPGDPTEAPVRLQAGGIGVDVEVVPVGVTDGDVMELPRDPAVAGWYRYGPGIGDDAGAVVVAAHVDSLEYGLGPFAAFADAPAGTEIALTAADGSAERYAIVARETSRKGSVDWDAVFDREGAKRLAIITCGGEFDWERRTYLDSVVVWAEPIG